MSSFNIDLSNKNKSAAIGIIGRASGMTTMVIADKEEQEKFITYAAEHINPCERTLKQLEEYLIEKYQAIPYTLLNHELKVLKANVIMNYFGELLDRPAPLGENPTLEDIRAYVEEDTSFFQAREFPAEKLGLEMKAYKLLGIQSCCEDGEILKNKSYIAYHNEDCTEKNVIVEMEMKTGYLCIRNDDDKVMDELTLYKGVSEKDIREKSPRFIGYAYLLKRMGRLTDIMEV
jgi:hypothetical protein